MQSYQFDYEILGSEMQMVEIELDPGASVVAKAGEMTSMEDGIGFIAKMGDGAEPARLPRAGWPPHGLDARRGPFPRKT